MKKKSLCNKYSKGFQEEIVNLVRSSNDNSTEWNGVTRILTIFNNAFTVHMSLIWKANRQLPILNSIISSLDSFKVIKKSIMYFNYEFNNEQQVLQAFWHYDRLSLLTSCKSVIALDTASDTMIIWSIYLPRD